MAESVKKPVSFNRLAKVVTASGKKMSPGRVIDYMGYLQESWLIFSMENITAKLAGKVANRKYYFIDNGILNLFLVDPLAALLENQVPIQLRHLYCDEVYFFHEGVEVDFYVPEVQLAVQVCYSLGEEATRRREVGALLKMAGRVEVKRMLVITRDEEETIYEEGGEIAVVPVWKWLLESRMKPING